MSWSEQEKEQIKTAGKQAAAAFSILKSAVEQVFDEVIEDPSILEKYAKVVSLGLQKMIDEGINKEDAIAILTSMLSKLGAAGGN